VRAQSRGVRKAEVCVLCALFGVAACAHDHDTKAVCAHTAEPLSWPGARTGRCPGRDATASATQPSQSESVRVIPSYSESVRVSRLGHLGNGRPQAAGDAKASATQPSLSPSLI
jgi:hypothetical protein